MGDFSRIDIMYMLLESIRLSPPGGRWQFLWNSEGCVSFFGGITFKFFIDFEHSNRVIIEIMKEYQPIFSGKSVEQVRSILMEFLEKNFILFDRQHILSSFGKQVTLASLTSDDVIRKLVILFNCHSKDLLRGSLYLKPALGINCPEKIDDDDLIWFPGNADLSEIFKKRGFPAHDLENGKFPPMKMGNRYQNIEVGDSWFGCIASSDMDADSKFQRIAGALSMAIELPYSRQFSGKKMPKGVFSFHWDGRRRLRDAPSLVPALLDIERTRLNNASASMIRRLILSNSPERGRIQVALEFVAAGWQPLGRTGFLNNTIAFDALFGVERAVRKSILLGVEKYAEGIDQPGDRIDLLLRMRNALLHGNYSRIEFCPEYLDYHSKFDVGPVIDQLRILRACLWEKSMEYFDRKPEC